MALACLHHVVVAYDLRGHGGSSWASEYPVGRHVSDCRALIEQVAGGPSHLVGHGWSAGLAALVARHHPDLVRSLTLVSPVDELAPLGVVRRSMVRLHQAVEYTAWRARGRARLARRLATRVYDPDRHPDGHALLEADARRADPRAACSRRAGR